MNIKSVIYENLTAPQRVIAALEAEIRGDEDEAMRLIRTCPRKTYEQADAAFLDTVKNIFAAAQAVRLDLMENAMGYICLIKLGRYDAAENYMQNVADIHAAWHETLEAIGMEASLIDSVGGPLSPFLKVILKNAPFPNPESVKEIREAMENIL